jgi:hypothetical protein
MLTSCVCLLPFLTPPTLRGRARLEQGRAGPEQGQSGTRTGAKSLPKGGRIHSTLDNRWPRQPRLTWTDSLKVEGLRYRCVATYAQFDLRRQPTYSIHADHATRVGHNEHSHLLHTVQTITETSRHHRPGIVRPFDRLYARMMSIMPGQRGVTQGIRPRAALAPDAFVIARAAAGSPPPHWPHALFGA